ncbi:MAG: iron-containing redox enzyme family protein [Acidobacteriota bacterium]|nr:iron-containing redox enzyme family protein [Acidobacteriota bacterium]
MDIRTKLKSNSARNRLYHHPLFQLNTVDRDKVSLLLGQYWRPLHFFPNFLSRMVNAVPQLAVKTAVSTILFEELGEGRVDKAHERIYLASLTDLGFAETALTDAEPFEETRRLVEIYAETAEDLLPALGSLYATESTDLAIVSGIGKLITAATGAGEIPWVDIHIRQEPNHVAQTDLTVVNLTPEEEEQVIAHAERMWQAWNEFFTAIERSFCNSPERSAPKEFRTCPDPQRAGLPAYSH